MEEPGARTLSLCDAQPPRRSSHQAHSGWAVRPVNASLFLAGRTLRSVARYGFHGAGLRRRKTGRLSWLPERSADQVILVGTTWLPGARHRSHFAARLGDRGETRHDSLLL